MKIVFFNKYGAGDVHVSRGIIRMIMPKIKELDPAAEFIYSHPKQYNLLSDIPNLLYDPELWKQLDKYDNLIKRGDHLFINSWYVQSNWRYMKPYGLTLDAIYAAFDDTCQQQWGFGLADISNDIKDFFPQIDYTKYQLDNTKKWLAKHPERKVLVETGDTFSGQSSNFPMLPLVVELANKHPDIAFIASRKEPGKMPKNLYFTDDIIRKDRRYQTDLNEISYLSTQCEMLVGRASGVSSFVITKENMFDRSSFKYMVFTKYLPKYPDKYWISDLLKDKVKYSAKTIASSVSEPQRILEKIEAEL
jgi:hypothetical protein